MPSFNYEDLPERTPLDAEGWFPVEVTGAAEMIKSGDDIIVLDFSTKEGKSIRDDLYFTQKAQWRVEKFLKKVGYPMPAKGEQLTVAASELMGGQLHILVGLDHWNDKTTGAPRSRLKVKDFLAIDEKPPEPVKPAAAPAAPAKPPVVLGKPKPPADLGY